MPDKRRPSRTAARPRPGSSTSSVPPSQQLKLFRQAVETSDEIVFMTDREGIFTFVNPEFERVYGYLSADVVGRCTPRILKSGLLPAETYEGFWEALLKGEVVCREWSNRCRDGSLVEIEISANPIFDQSDRVIGFLAVQRNVTDRKRAEAALRDSEARHRALAERLTAERELLHTIITNSPIGMALLRGTDLIFEMVNPAYQQVVPDRPMVGRRFRDVWPELAQERVPLIEHALRTGEIAEYENVEIAIPPGPRESAEPRSFAVTHVPISLPERDEPGLVIMVLENTKRRTLEGQIRRAQKMEVVGRLAGGIAHDFNNLLTAVLGYSEILADKLTPDDPRHAEIEGIRKAAESGAWLTRQLLAFGRKQVIQPTVVDLNVAVRQMERIIYRTINADIEVVLQLSPDVRHIYIDPGQIEQVLLNLVLNARDAMPDGGCLTIETANVRLGNVPVGNETAVPGHYVRLTVLDGGVGMSAEVQAHLFEPFFTTKLASKGSGLGLATVYGIVKQSHGYVNVTSAPGRGTKFEIFIPETDRPMPSDAPQTEASSSNGAGETILIVEDDEVLRGLASETLQHLGYIALTASSSEEALELSRTYPRPIDLLLTDVIMPHRGGAALAQRLVLLRPNIRILYMSSYADSAVNEAGELPPGIAFLQKPFTRQILAAKIREVIDRPSAFA